MRDTDMQSELAIWTCHAGEVDMQLEIIVIPVSDVDRNRCLYDSSGWKLDIGKRFKDGCRVIQSAPSGSNSSIFCREVSVADPGRRLVSVSLFCALTNKTLDGSLARSCLCGEVQYLIATRPPMQSYFDQRGYCS
jgi:hypothetical protein